MPRYSTLSMTSHSCNPKFNHLNPSISYPINPNANPYLPTLSDPILLILIIAFISQLNYHLISLLIRSIKLIQTNSYSRVVTNATLSNDLHLNLIAI